MASIYKAPITAPELDFGNPKAFNAEWAKYEEELKAWCINRKPSEHVGEIIKFPVADGNALYMVASLSPVELIHLDYLDCYSFEYANRLKASDIRERISNQNKLNRLFGSKK